jgi:hypothetical protein
MPNLSIVPASAVMDRDLTPTQLRCLCAIGIHTNRLGGNVWASVRTLASEAGVSERTFQGACQALETRGYIKTVSRPGRTNLYEVVLDPPPQPAAPPHQLLHPTPAGAVADERPKGTTPKLPVVEREDVDDLIARFPQRPEPPVWPAVMKALKEVRRGDVPLDRIYRAAERYAAHCSLNKTEPQYVKSLVKWLSDGTWRTYDVLTVYGRTRDEWRLSGQDVWEFDRLAGLTQPEEVTL